MKWKALLSAAALAAMFLPQAAWSRNHHLLNLPGSSSSSVLSGLTHSGGLTNGTSGIANSLTNTASNGILHGNLLGIGNNTGLMGSSLNNGKNIFSRKRHKGLIAWLRSLLFGSNNNNSLGTFGNKNYQNYSGSLFNSNGLNGCGGVHGFLNRN